MRRSDRAMEVRPWLSPVRRAGTRPAPTERTDRTAESPPALRTSRESRDTADCRVHEVI